MENDWQRLKSAGGKYSLICAGLGVLVAALITTVLLAVFAGTGLHQIVVDPYFRAPIAVGLLSLAFAALVFGRLAGRVISRFGVDSAATPVIGISLALSCLVISVTSAFTTHFFVSINELGTFSDYIVGPALGIIGFGCVPATILGLAFSAMIRSNEPTSSGI